MEEVEEAFQSLKIENVQCLMQEMNMNEEKRESFLQNFEEERENTLVGFCVLGGVFSEGIDLTGERLIGAIIVGTGLPQVCTERELLKQHFDSNYSYLYPGMNKVLQAAGRVIRTEEDRGIVALLDERFREWRYIDTFPREWKQIDSCTVESVSEKIKEFWNKKE